MGAQGQGELHAAVWEDDQRWKCSVPCGRLAAMHPDCNLVFFVQHRDCKMVSYDIDRQEVQALDTDLQDDYQITPYVPYLSELFLGVIGAHKLAH